MLSDRSSGPRDGLAGDRIGTLQRGLAIMEAVADAPRRLTLLEIAAQAGLDQSTALRLLRVLEESGYVVRDAASRRYAPSPKLIHPLPLNHPLEQLRREARSVLTDLAHELAATVILVLFRGAERMVLDIALVPHGVAPYYGTWLRGPLHASGVGKAMLAGMTGGERDELLGSAPLERFTPATIIDRADLDRELALSAERGYVMSRGEYRPGITNVARSLRSWSGTAVGCVNISARKAEMDDAACERCGEALGRATEQLMYQAPSLEAAARYLNA